MEIISSKRFILLTLATLSLLTPNIFCTDELMMPHFHSQEKDDKYPQVSLKNLPNIMNITNINTNITDILYAHTNITDIL